MRILRSCVASAAGVGGDLGAFRMRQFEQLGSSSAASGSGAARAAPRARSRSGRRCRCRVTSPPTGRRSSAATSCGPPTRTRRAACWATRSSSTILSDASSPAQVVTNYQKLIGSDKDQLVFGPFSSLLTVPVRAHRRALRLRVRRGRRRRAGGVRRRPAQRVRRLDPGQGQPRHLRALGGVDARRAAAQDRRVRDRQRPVHPAADRRSPSRSSRAPASRRCSSRCSPPRSPTTPRSPARWPRPRPRSWCSARSTCRPCRRSSTRSSSSTTTPRRSSPPRARPGRAVHQGRRQGQ